MPVSHTPETTVTSENSDEKKVLGLSQPPQEVTVHCTPARIRQL
jgi:hypothetical protein